MAEVLVEKSDLIDVLEFIRVSSDLGFAEAVLNDLDISDSAFEQSVTRLDKVTEEVI